ncbi:MAG: phosphoribosylglycinamide formyltransferase [Planctomycetes bacterium]|nr:phosphoribosylglycinamide formyltransferase [Planctomycetota bacterium]
MPDKIEKVNAYVDGGSRGNPGPAAAAFVLTDNNQNQLQAKAFFLGKATNNVAEYTSFIKALEAAKRFKPKEFVLFSDSELLVRQINGQYKVKSDLIRPLFTKAVDLLDDFENWKVYHVTRDKNTQADKLVNQALDLGRDVEMKTKNKKNQKPIRLAVLISGGGTTLINILEYIKKGQLNAEVPLVISSRSTVAGVERAKTAGLNVKIIRKKDYPDIDQFSKALENEIKNEKIDLVIQAGWLCLWKIPDKYMDRVMNIHPALLPSFGGKGMWGHHVHQAVIDAGCKVSGCTVHFCTNEYDKGPIIVQRTCPVEDDDTPDTLAARVFEQECIAYPQAIELFQEKKLLVQNEIVKIKQ